MTYNNNFDPTKLYEEVRFNQGQKPVSQEFNEMQNLSHDKLLRAFDVLVAPGYIYDGLTLISLAGTTLHIASGYVHLDGIARYFNTQAISLAGLLDDADPEVIDIYAQVEYLKVTKDDDSELAHPLQPDLPVGDRAQQTTSLFVGSPNDLDDPSDLVRRSYVKVLQFNRLTKTLTKIVTNLNKLLRLENLPGQVQPGQVAPGAVRPEDITVLLDGLPLRDALAVRTKDAEGDFIARGGALIYEDNVAGGVQVRLEAFRAYVNGYQVRVDADTRFLLDHTNTTLTRNNESKVFTTGTNTYTLTKTPAAAITALDGDVAVTNENVTRGSGDYDNLALTPVVDIVEITQVPSTTYVKDTDYEVIGDQVHWLSGGSRPTQGTTYQVDYKYRREFIINTDVELDTDRNSITFISATKPVNSSSFQVSYTYYVPRTDIITVDRDAVLRVVKGTPADVASAPVVPEGNLLLGRINLPAGTQLLNTFLNANGYAAPGAGSIAYRNLQIQAARMRDHQRRNKLLSQIAYNDTLNAAVQYFTTRDPSLTKLGVFGDDLYDDRLSDYGKPDQTMRFNSDNNTGVHAQTSEFQFLEMDEESYDDAVFSSGNYLSLEYDEVSTIEQNSWSQEVNLQPYSEIYDARTINVPNNSLIKGQEFTIIGRNWNYGEDNIQFFINGERLTDITVDEGDEGSEDDSVDPTDQRSFVVRFTVPDTIPIGYRIITATSYTSGNSAEFISAVQVAAPPPPPPVPTIPTLANDPCSRVRRYITRIRGRRRGIIERYSCELNAWVRIGIYDPVAQTFVPDADQFLTSVDVYFTSKDTVGDVFCAIINTKDGEPDVDSGILASTSLQPSDVVTDGTATKFTFDRPVFVKAGTTYAIYLESYTTGYRVQYAKLGSLDRTKYAPSGSDLVIFSSASPSPIGPFLGVADNQKRDRNTTHRFTSKTYTFTPSTNVNLYHIDAPAYVGPDSYGTTGLTVTNHGASPFSFLQTGVAHKLTTGDQVAYVVGGGSAIGGLVDGGVYFVRVNNSTQFNLHRTEEDALNGVNTVPLSSSPSGSNFGTISRYQRVNAVWELKDITNDTILWSNVQVLHYLNKQSAGKFTAKGYEGMFENGAGETFDAPIGLISGRQYRLRVYVQAGSDYGYLRDDYADDGVVNGKLYTLKQTAIEYEKVSRNALTTGILFYSPDKINWFGQPEADLRFKLYRADYSQHTSATITFKPFVDGAGAGEVELADTFTHFTPLLTGLLPQDTKVLMEYSLDGTAWLSVTPRLFKILEFDNEDDRETWSYYNFGYFAEQRFEEEQIDPQYFPVDPQLEFSAGTLADEIHFRLTISTTNSRVSPVIDISNWAVRFAKNGLTTTYYSRNLPLTDDADTAKAYFWAVIPSGVTYSVAFTTDGDAVSPTYITKTSPDSTRVIDSANDIVEYQFDFDDLSGQSDLTNARLKIVFTTANRLAQPVMHRAGFNVFPA